MPTRAFGNRRRFLGTTATGAAVLAAGGAQAAKAAGGPERPALLGGPRAFPGDQPGWPVWDRTDEEGLLGALRSGHWFRSSGKFVTRFEDAYAEQTGARYCLATSSGTAALSAALGALEIGPGDEVIIPPYTFVATYNVVVLNHALPVFVDTDPESFQIDAARVEAAVTKETRAILPVHIGGSPADLGALVEVGKKRGIPVIEDACQAHEARWKDRHVGTWGLGGCFSFQASKNLTSGEGGAVLTQDEAFADACYRFHYQGRGRRFSKAGPDSGGTRGSNLRLSEFQAALLLAQMPRLNEQTRRRNENAAHLSSLLREIPGIRPAKLYEGTTRSAWHLYMFRYDKTHFAGLERNRFIAALGREGVPASGGYAPLNRDPYVTALARDRHYLRVYGEARMKEWLERTMACPRNEEVCASAVWFTQNMLLGSRADMERIAEAIRKVQRNAAEIAKA